MTSTLDRPSGSPFESVPAVPVVPNAPSGATGPTVLESFDFNQTRRVDVGLEPVFRSRPSAKLLTAIGLAALVIVLLATQIAYILADLKPDLYAARAEVTYSGDTWVETQAELVRARDLIGPVAKKEGIPIEQFEAFWTAGQVPGTQIIEFEYASEDPAQALRIVEGVVGTYLDRFRAEAAAESPHLASLRDLREQHANDIAEYIAEIEEIARGLGANETSPELTVAMQALQNARGSFNQVNLQIITAEQWQSVAVPVLSDPPYAIADPVAPVPRKQAIFGFLGGLALAAAFVFVALRIAADRR